MHKTINYVHLPSISPVSEKLPLEFIPLHSNANRETPFSPNFLLQSAGMKNQENESALMSLKSFLSAYMLIDSLKFNVTMLRFQVMDVEQVPDLIIRTSKLATQHHLKLQLNFLMIVTINRLYHDFF